MVPDTNPKEVRVTPDTTERFLAAVEERKHAMYRVALMMLRNPADAQDAVSDALEATWRNILRIRNLDALPAYLLRAVRKLPDKS
ncbi:MAG: hypothetical protein GX810_10210 [Clostridiales bacterium]|nr:hypothetical protein [Clostridiales bacterium]